MAVADLDLDLDVFAGPFDLLMAVVLREEVSLLELQLGEVVVAYVEHLEREGELELEVATEFLVLIAALLELKSRLMLPGAEDELEELEPGGGGRGAAGADARVPPLPRRLRGAGRALRGRARLPLPLGAAAGRAAPGRGRRRHRRLRPRAARRRPRRPADRAAARSTSATSARPSRWSGACGRCATSLRRRTSFDFDEEFGGEDRLTQAVTVFALLELYRKGEVDLGAERAVRPDPRSRRAARSRAA